MPKLKKRELQNLTVGERIRARRLVLGLSQTDLGKLLKISFQQVQKYENGSNSLNVARMKQVAAALQVTPLYFIADNEVVNHDDIKLILTPGARKMLTAFNKVTNGRARERLIALVETYAEAPETKR